MLWLSSMPNQLSSTRSAPDERLQTGQKIRQQTRWDPGRRPLEIDLNLQRQCGQKEFCKRARSFRIPQMRRFHAKICSCSLHRLAMAWHQGSLSCTQRRAAKLQSRKKPICTTSDIFEVPGHARQSLPEARRAPACIVALLTEQLAVCRIAV